MKMYVLIQVGFGVIANSESLQKIADYYNAETENGTKGGFFVHQIEIQKQAYSNMNFIDLYIYMRSLCNEKNKVVLK